MGCLLEIIIFAAVVGICYLILGPWGILVGIIIGGLLFWILDSTDAFGKLDDRISVSARSKRDKKKYNREQAKRDAEAKKSAARDAVKTEKAVSKISASGNASLLLQTCLKDFPYPNPDFIFESAKPDKPSIPTVTISARTRLHFFVSSTGIFADDDSSLSFSMYRFIFNEHGFANQPDPDKREQLLRAFVDGIAKEYERRYPQIKAETSGVGDVILSTTRIVANPNYNKQSW